jgi:glycosyltransferase involved in cell wall biosynthesis
MLINALPGLIRIVRPAARVAVTMHGFREQGVLFRLRALPMLRLAHGVIFVDRKNERLLRAYSGHGSSRLRFIPIAGNIPPIEVWAEERRRLRMELGFGEEDVIVAFFGGIGRSKGFHHLVKAVELARTEFGLSAVLLAIGGFHEDGVNRGYQEQMKVEIGKRPASGWVRIIDAPPPARASELLRCADIAAYPFLDGVGENSGSMMAALAHGLPTIATKGHGNPPDFEDHFGVAVVPPRDSRALAEKIVSLANSPDTRARMKKRALEVTQARSWPPIAAQTAGFFQSLLQKGHHH